MPRPPLTNAAFGILPTTGVVVRLKRTTSHRNALNYILDNEGVLSRYRMTFFPGVLKHDRDWMVSMCKHFRKTGV